MSSDQGPSATTTAARRNRPLAGAHLPAAAQGAQRARIALQEASAALLEQARIGLHDGARVGHADGLGHQHAADLRAPQMRLQLAQPRGIEGPEIDAVGLEVAFVLGDLRVQGLRPSGGSADSRCAGSCRGCRRPPSAPRARRCSARSAAARRARWPPGPPAWRPANSGRARARSWAARSSAGWPRAAGSARTGPAAGCRAGTDRARRPRAG